MGYSTTQQCDLSHLKELEAESIHIIREVVAQFAKPVMLYSIGKGQLGHTTPCGESFLAFEAAVPAAAHRYDVEVQRDDRIPRLAIGPALVSI